MKQLIKLILTCLCLISLTAPIVKAEGEVSTSSKVTFYADDTSPSSSSSGSSKQPVSEGDLPQTGEIKSQLIFVGLGIVGASVIVFLLFKRRKEEEDYEEN